MQCIHRCREITNRTALTHHSNQVVGVKKLVKNCRNQSLWTLYLLWWWRTSSRCGVFGAQGRARSTPASFRAVERNWIPMNASAVRVRRGASYLAGAEWGQLVCSCGLAEAMVWGWCLPACFSAEPVSEVGKRGASCLHCMDPQAQIRSRFTYAPRATCVA